MRCLMSNERPKVKDMSRGNVTYMLTQAISRLQDDNKYMSYANMQYFLPKFVKKIKEAELHGSKSL